MNRNQSPIPTDYHDGLSLISSVAGAIDFGLEGPADDLAMRLERCTLGPIYIFRYEGRGLHRARRSPRQARDNHRDDILILLPISKPLRLSQCRRDSVVEPGSLCLMSTGLPFELQGGEPPTYGYSEMFVRIPASLLRKKSPLVDMYYAVPIDADHGVCKIVKRLVESIFDEHEGLSSTERMTFGDLLLDALSMISARGSQTSSEAALFSEHRNLNSAVLSRAQSFIDSNLSNPDLSMRMIAAHCNVSERRLYAVFASSGTTVGAYQRDSRLQRCRAELNDSRLSDYSIFEIAMRWGYSNPASFSRAYRTKFGCSPRMERKVSRQTG